MADLQLISEDFFYKVFVSYFEGKPIRFIYDKFKNEIRVNADDMIKIFGYSDWKSYLGTDNGLDFISHYKKQHPDTQLFGKQGSGAAVEEFQLNETKD